MPQDNASEPETPGKLIQDSQAGAIISVDLGSVRPNLGDMRSLWIEPALSPLLGSGQLTELEPGFAQPQEVRQMNGAILEERVQVLALRHRQLKDEVSLLERRAYLTPVEQRRIAELKKQKLLVKDELYQARRDSEPPRALS